MSRFKIISFFLWAALPSLMAAAAKPSTFIPWSNTVTAEAFDSCGHRVTDTAIPIGGDRCIKFVGHIDAPAVILEATGPNGFTVLDKKSLPYGSYGAAGGSGVRRIGDFLYAEYASKACSDCPVHQLFFIHRQSLEPVLLNGASDLGMAQVNNDGSVSVRAMGFSRDRGGFRYYSLKGAELIQDPQKTRAGYEKAFHAWGVANFSLDALEAYPPPPMRHVHKNGKPYPNSVSDADTTPKFVNYPDSFGYQMLLEVFGAPLAPRAVADLKRLLARSNDLPEDEQIYLKEELALAYGLQGNAPTEERIQK